jgi:predicted branched-subunit amino acid permease
MTATETITGTATGPTTRKETESGSANAETRSAIRVALTDTAPLGLAVVPFALAIGARVSESELSAAAALSGSVLMMAGASQLAVIQLLDSGAGAVAALTTALLINARLVLYSSALAQWFDGAGRGRRLLLALPLIDQNFMLAQQRFGPDTTQEWRQRYWIVGSSVLLCCFVAFQIVGYVIGGGLPDGMGLHLAAPLVFAGMLGAGLRDNRAVKAAVVSAAVVVLAGSVLGTAALPVAAIAGLLAAGNPANTKEATA